jgi:hypothetical protein
MQTPTTNNTEKPMNEDKSGSGDTNSVFELDPWDIVDLLICKRGEQLINVKDATDTEFDEWVKTNAIPVKENGITSWSFDDRCRLMNHVLGEGGVLEFVNGLRLPEDEEEGTPTQPFSKEDADGTMQDASL